MRRGSAFLSLGIALLLVAPVGLGVGGAHVTLLSAHLRSVFDPAEQNTDPVGILFDGGFGSHQQLTFTVRNDGGEGSTQVALDAWWLVTGLPTTVWAEDPVLSPAEERTFVADVGTNWIWIPPGPWWLCLRLNNDEIVRCWSVLMGAPYPDGAYPESVPFVPVLGPNVPMGDTP